MGMETNKRNVLAFLIAILMSHDYDLTRQHNTDCACFDSYILHLVM